MSVKLIVCGLDPATNISREDELERATRSVAYLKRQGIPIIGIVSIYGVERGTLTIRQEAGRQLYEWQDDRTIPRSVPYVPPTLPSSVPTSAFDDLF